MEGSCGLLSKVAHPRKIERNGVLSCEMPPTGSSPPSQHFMNIYLRSVLYNKKLTLNQEMYKSYGTKSPYEAGGAIAS